MLAIPCAMAVVLAQDAPRSRNTIIFVADGLRHGSVNPTDRLRQQPPPRAANLEDQQWFADVVTKGILPAFGKSAEPFVLVFWSDAGPTSVAAIRSADRNLKQILEYLDAHADVRDITNIFVTADHGFSTVSHREVDFAIGLAHELGLPLYDPEVQITDPRGVKRYGNVDPTIGQETAAVRQRPSEPTALIGGTGKIERPTDAKVIVAQTSIHVPDNDRGMVQRIVRLLARQEYVGGIFVNDRFGPMAGALQLSDIGLLGRATTPKPAVFVNFNGSISRADTFINMAAMGPDFKKGFVARAPAGNADIQPTLAHILRMKIPSLGKLRGRVLNEALAGGPQTIKFSSEVARSRPSQRGESTVLMYQRVGDHHYLDEACFTREQTCR